MLAVLRKHERPPEVQQTGKQAYKQILESYEGVKICSLYYSFLGSFTIIIIIINDVRRSHLWR